MASDGKNVTVIVKGKSYQWFNPSIIRTNAGSEDFIHVLRSNIAHYFGVPVDYQVLCDKAGLLVGHADLVRFLVHPMPQLWVYDGRQMSREEKANTLSKLTSLGDDIAKLRSCLNTRYEAASNSGILSNGGAVADSGGLPGSPGTAGDIAGSDVRLGSPISQPDGTGSEGLRSSPPLGPGDEAGKTAGSDADPTRTRRPTFREARVPPPWMPEEAEGLGTPRASVSPTRPQTSEAPFGPGFQPSSPSRPNSPGGASDSDRFIEIFLQKDAAGTRYGFAGVPAEDGRDLLVTWVDPSGLLARWNSTNPDRAVLPGAWIVAVNHEHERADGMLAQLQSPSAKILARTSGGGPPRRAAAQAVAQQAPSTSASPSATLPSHPASPAPVPAPVPGFSPMSHLAIPTSPSPSFYAPGPGPGPVLPWSGPTPTPAATPGFDPRLGACGGAGFMMPGGPWPAYPLPMQMHQVQQW